jgi:septal ring factor EnvC (AmiA/AmiB activator)
MASSVPLSRSTLRVGGGSAFFVRLLAHITDMTPAQILTGFWKWVTLYHSRELSITKAQLALVEQQKRTEVFLLEQSLHQTETERDGLKATVEAIRTDNDGLKQKLDESRVEIDGLHKELDGLQSIKASLKEQTQLQNRIRQLENINQNLEAQLRIRHLGF